MAKRARKSALPKREYSKDFPTTETRRHQFMVDKIPAGLMRRVRDKAKREGVSLRALVLGFLAEWTSRER